MTKKDKYFNIVIPLIGFIFFITIIFFLFLKGFNLLRIIKGSGETPTSSEISTRQVSDSLLITTDDKIFKIQSKRQITFSKSPDLHPRWSPDNKYIAFHSLRKGNYDIWLFNCENSTIDQLTSNLKNEKYASWSPDGKKIVFARYSKDIEEMHGDLFIMNLENRRIIQLTSDNSTKLYVTWTRDIRKVLYSDMAGTRKFFY